MGKEQGTLVSGPIIDLPQYKDLIDLRLPRAFRVWAAFKENHNTEIARIGTLAPEVIAVLANELSSLVSRVIGTRDNKVSPVEAEKLTRLTDIIAGEGNRIIFMRHGEQSPPEWISSISDPAIRKIRMMQNPFNREDCLTNNAFLDVFATALSLFYIQETTGRNLHILSSENRRAEEVAGIISDVIPNSTLSIEEGLDSVSYRDENDDPPVILEQLLEDLPLGTMPWIPRLVDKLCKKTRNGVRQSDVIIKTIADLMHTGFQNEGTDLIVVLTHSQQLAEVLRVAGILQDPYIRFPELTMISVRNENDLIILPRGVLSEPLEDKSGELTKKYEEKA